MEGRILSATVNWAADRWFMSLTVEQEIPDPVSVDGPACGIDVGLHHFATIAMEDGVVEKVEAPKPLQRYLRILHRCQRQHSRKRKGSRNRKKSALRVARLHRRIRNVRRDLLHKLSTHLAKTKRAIVVEDLRVAGLLRNDRLARHIADAGWREFRRMLEYKTQWYGSNLIVAHRYFLSSKTCSACGHVMGKMPLGIREWRCPACSMDHDWDVNAVSNLLARAGEGDFLPPVRREVTSGGDGRLQANRAGARR